MGFQWRSTPEYDEEGRPQVVILPRDLLGRFASLLISLFFAPLTGMMFWMTAFHVKTPKTWPSMIGKILLEEATLLGCAFFSLLFIWAIATPRWVERLIQWCAGKMVLVLLIAAALFIAANWLDGMRR
jgi:hypothetical protein